MFETVSATNISRLTLDILQLILEYLDTYSLAELSQTCRLFHSLVRRELSFESARFHLRVHQLQQARTARQDSISVFPMSGDDGEGDGNEDDDNDVSGEYTQSTTSGGGGAGGGYAPQSSAAPTTATTAATPTIPLNLPPPVYHQRCIACIGNRLYMPFMTMEPVCFIYDIQRGIWQRQQLQPYPGYTPFVAPVATIGSRIYMFGGRQVMSATLSNEIVVLDTETWSFDRIRLMRGQVPRPRHDHTVDVLNRRYLVVFGGACSNSPGENDLHLFDTETNTWNEPRTEGQIPPIRFGHASAVLHDDLYIFGGCHVQPEWNMVHDVLYRLDSRTWTWYKYDHPEAYSYRRGDAVMRTAPIADSLRRDLILETTGHPPRDRFYCTMQAIGSHKLIILGGQTVRQDRDDNNILHAHSLRSVDVFNIRRKHWSAIPTTSFDGEHHAYPQDLSCFTLPDNQQDAGYSLLLIGQQKSFPMSTGDSSSGGSSGELYPHTGSTPSTGGGSLTHISPPMRPQPLVTPEHDTYASTPHLPTARQPQPPPLMHAHTSPDPSISTRHLASSSSSTAAGTTATSPPAHVHPHVAFIPATHHNHYHQHHYHHQYRQPADGLDQRARRTLSRPVTDYEGFFEHINAYEEYIQNPAARNRGSQQSGSSGDSLASHPLPAPSSSSSIYPVGSTTTTLPHPHPPATTALTMMQDHPVFSPVSEGGLGDQSGGSSSSSYRQHYNIEPLCMMLTLDRE